MGGLFRLTDAARNKCKFERIVAWKFRMAYFSSDQAIIKWLRCKMLCEATKVAPFLCKGRSTLALKEWIAHLVDLLVLVSKAPFLDPPLSLCGFCNSAWCHRNNKKKHQELGLPVLSLEHRVEGSLGRLPVLPKHEPMIRVHHLEQAENSWPCLYRGETFD